MNPAPVGVDGEHPVAELALSLDRDPGAPAVARAAIAGFCEGRHVSGSVLSTLLLLVSEIVTNAVVHADAEPSQPVGFAAWLHRAFVRVEVTDQGSGFTVQARDPSRLGRRVRALPAREAGPALGPEPGARDDRVVRGRHLNCPAAPGAGGRCPARTRRRS